MTAALFEGVDDRELVRRHVAGDPDAFGELFRRHQDRMWAVATSVCRDREMAAEAVQEGFVAAFRRAAGYRGDAAVTTWLHRIVVNASLDQLRRVRPTTELTPEREALLRAPGDAPGQVDTRMLVEAALDELPEGQRLALVLVDMHGVPVAEAAQTLGVAAGTVKSRCARGRQRLAELLGPSVTGTPGGPTTGTSTAAPTSDVQEMPDPQGPGRGSGPRPDGEDDGRRLR